LQWVLCVHDRLVDDIAAGAIINFPPRLFDDAQHRDEPTARDGAELKRLLADDYSLVNSSGNIETKAQLIADYTAPGYKLDLFEVREAIEKVWADGAVMGGVVRLSGTDGGKRFQVTLRFADIWARRHGVWRVVYTHVSKP
jgi:hypothetical protein